MVTSLYYMEVSNYWIVRMCKPCHRCLNNTTTVHCKYCVPLLQIMIVMELLTLGDLDTYLYNNYRWVGMMTQYDVKLYHFCYIILFLRNKYSIVNCLSIPLSSDLVRCLLLTRRLCSHSPDKLPVEWNTWPGRTLFIVTWQQGTC